MVAGRAAAGVGGGRAAEHEVGGGERGVDRRRAPPPRCPGRSASSCRRRSGRCAPTSRPGPPASSVPSSPGWGKKYGTTRSWPGSSDSPAALPLVPCAARGSRAAPRRGPPRATRRRAAASAATNGAPGALERVADRVGAPRHLDVPGVRTPTQTLRRARAAACASLQTIGSASLIGGEPNTGGWQPLRFAPCPGRRTARPAPARARAADRRARAGPANAITDVAGVRRRPRHRLARRARRRGRGVARTGVTAIAAATRRGARSTSPCRPASAVLNGAGEMTGFVAGRRSGACSRRRSTSRRRWRSGAIYDGAVARGGRRPIPRSGARTSSSRSSPSATTAGSTTAARVQVEARRTPGARAGAARRRPGRRGRGRRRHRHGLLRLEGRHRHGEPRSCPSRRDRRRARAGELRLGAATCASTASRSAARSRADAGAVRDAPPAGSCIGVVATDAPLGPAQLARLARRAGLGLARTGSVAHHGSGEIFLAFATGAPRRSAAARGTRTTPSSTRCSPPPSRPPRRRCSTRSGPRRDVAGRAGASRPGCRTTTSSSSSRARPARALTTVRPERPRVGQPA